MKFNIPCSPIKTTPLDNTSSFEQTTDNLEQDHSKNIGVTAIVATIRSGPELRPKVKANKNKYSKPKTSSKHKVPKGKIIRILLDSESNGDLLFCKIGTDKSFPYLVRQDPKIWSMLIRDFKIKKKRKGSLEV